MGPLHDLTKKDVRFKWEPHHQKCFEELKRALTTTPCLAFPDSGETRVIQTDASDGSIGGFIGKLRKADGKVQVIAYFNKRLSSAEQRFGTVEKELLAIMVATRNYKKWLMDGHFYIYTDHKPLLALNKMKTSANQRIYRWGIELSQFDFEVIYFAGPSNIIADNLSRLRYARDLEEREPEKMSSIDSAELVKRLDYTREDVINVLQLEEDEITIEFDNDIEGYQDNDPYCQTIKKVLTEKSKKFPEITKKFRLIDGVIYKRKRRNQRDPNTLQVVIPEALIPKLLDLLHNARETGSHFGFDKTEAKIVDRYFFQNSREHIRTHIRQCERCARTRYASNKPFGIPQTIETPEVPMSTIHMDLMGPFGRSSRNNKYVITIVDRTTRFIFAKAVPTKQARHYIDFIKEIMYEFNAPAKLVTDRDGAFEDSCFRGFLLGLGIDHVKTARYYASSNGIAERGHGRILSSLRRYCNHNSKEWDIELKSVVKAINMSLNSITLFSAFYLMYGFNPINAFERKLKIRLIKEFPEIEDNLQSEMTTDITVEKARQEARKRIEEAENKWNKLRESGLRTPPFKVGSIVWATDKTQEPTNRNPLKLRELHDGPYVITAEPIPGTYHILHMNKRRNRKKRIYVVNSRLLFPFFGPTPKGYDDIMRDIENGVYRAVRTVNKEVWDVENINRWLRILKREDTQYDHMSYPDSEEEEEEEVVNDNTQNEDYNTQDMQLLPISSTQITTAEETDSQTMVSASQQVSESQPPINTQISDIQPDNSVIQQGISDSQPNISESQTDRTNRQEVDELFNMSDSSFNGFTPLEASAQRPEQVSGDAIQQQLMRQNTEGYVVSQQVPDNRQFPSQQSSQRKVNPITGYSRPIRERHLPVKYQ